MTTMWIMLIVMLGVVFALIVWAISTNGLITKEKEA
jgi:hypothetical protein